MSINARRAALLVAGGGIYATAVYFTFQFMSVNSIPEEEDNTLVPSKHSHIYNPLRIQTFQRIAPTYDDQIDKDEIVMGIKLLRRSLLYFHAKGHVLEIGAGTGRNLNYYPTQVNKVVLTDISDQMLLRAWNKLKVSSEPFRDRFKIFVADASHLPYEDDTFDTVVSTFGLCSFDDPVAVLKEMQRICKPGGKMLLLEHGRSKTFQGLTNYLDKNADRHVINWGCIWNRDIDELLRKADLDIERLHTWHFGTTYYVVCRPKKS